VLTPQHTSQPETTQEHPFMVIRTYVFTFRRLIITLPSFPQTADLEDMRVLKPSRTLPIKAARPDHHKQSKHTRRNKPKYGVSSNVHIIRSRTRTAKLRLTLGPLIKPRTIWTTLYNQKTRDSTPSLFSKTQLLSLEREKRRERRTSS